MRNIVSCAIALFALTLASCNSVNTKMTWEEFKQSDIIKTQGLEETDQELYAKTTAEGKGDACNYLQTLDLNVKFQTLAGEDIDSLEGTMMLTDLKEKSADIPDAIYQMKQGEVKEVYLPAESAKAVGWTETEDFPVLKAIITLKKIHLPTWTVEIEGKETILAMGMTVDAVYAELGTPFDGQRIDAADLLILTYKDTAKNKVFGLNFEGGKLTSVDETQL